MPPQGTAVEPQRFLQRVTVKSTARQPKQCRHVVGTVVTALGCGLEALRRLVNIVSGQSEVSARQPRQLLGAIYSVCLLPGGRGVESQPATERKQLKEARLPNIAVCLLVALVSMLLVLLQAALHSTKN